MIWLNSISELQYYNMPVNGICYCSILYHANDLMLQGWFPKGSGNYEIIVQTLSADGLTVYETSTSNFQSYFFNNPITQQHTFNLQLKAFTTQMCVRACWILHVVVLDSTTGGVVFDKYTERYCMSTCCDRARDITIDDEGINIIKMIDGFAVEPNFDEGLAPVLPPIISEKLTECGDPLITLRSRAACMDMDGNYYPIPSSTISGSATWGYEKVTNMRGKIAKRPRSIERTYSYNCRLQRVESQRVYLFEGYEYFPAWAADEIETQLSGSEIYVDDVRYEYNGGEPFTMASECKDIFRLKTELSDCVQRQVLGCNPDCAPSNFDGAQKMYVIPSAYQDGYFYDENKQLIAQDYDELLAYFRGLDGAYSVNELATSPLSCEVFAAFSLNSYGYVPNSFYYDTPINGNRVYAIQLDSIDEICPTYGQTCTAPDVSYYWVEEQICDDPVITYWWVEEDTSEVIVISGFGDWSNDGTSGGTIDGGVATITIGVGNPLLVTDPDSPAAPVFVAGDIIALIGANGRPSITLTFDSSNSPLTDDNMMTIDPDGFVRWFGEATEVLPDQAKVNVVNLIYSI